MKRIGIIVAGETLFATLRKSPTVDLLRGALPLKGRAVRWGNEVSLAVELDADLEEDARQEVEPGTLCYWPAGGYLLVPLGPSPISLDQAPKLVTACNQLGRIDGDLARLEIVQEGDEIAFIDIDSG